MADLPVTKQVGYVAIGLSGDQMVAKSVMYVLVVPRTNKRRQMTKVYCL